jgi:hypothetical protein
MSAFRGKADMTICGCPLLRSLLGVKRTWLFALHMSANDPKRTLAHHLDGGLVGTTSGFAHRRDRENELEQRPILAVRRRSKLATVTLGNPAANSQS